MITPLDAWLNRAVGTLSAALRGLLSPQRICLGFVVASVAALVPNARAQTFFSDNFDGATIGSAPPGWTATGTWRVRGYPTAAPTSVVVQNEDAVTRNGAPIPTLSRTLLADGSAVRDSWSVLFDYSWRYGGSSSFGNYAYVIDADVLDNGNNGYRVRVHQGASGGSASTVIELFRITAGVATLLPQGADFPSYNAQGPGYNEGGMAARGLSVPDLNRVGFSWDKITGELHAFYLPTGTALQLSARSMSPDYTAFTKIVFSVSGYGNTETPMLDNVTASALVTAKDDFNSGTIGAVPAGWTSTGTWALQDYTSGGTTIKLAQCNDATATATPYPSLSRALTATGEPVLTSWSLDFDYSWHYGGNTSAGNYNYVVDADLVDASNNGYRLRVHQGSLGGSANSIFEIFKLAGGSATLLAGGQGPGYDEGGWSARSLPLPDLNRVSFQWNTQTGELVAYRDPGGTGFEQSIRVKDPNYVPSTPIAFSKVVLSAGGWGSSAKPELDNVNFHPLPQFVWGICGHPYHTEYLDVGLSTQIAQLTDLGVTHYRVDSTNTVVLDQLRPIAESAGITVTPVLYIPAPPPNDPNGTDYVKGTFDPAVVYSACQAAGQAFATQFRGKFKYVELDNEVDNDCINCGVSGEAISQYNPDRLARASAALRGLADGIRAVDPAMRRIVDGGFVHFGFIDRLVADGLGFEILAWHWYSNMGSMGRAVKRLNSYGKPIWINETNCGTGSFFAPNFAPAFSGTELNLAPQLWTTADTWRVHPYTYVRTTPDCSGNPVTTHPVILLADELDTSDNGNTGRVLARALNPAITSAWTFDIDLSWMWGGNASLGCGSKDMITWVDFLDANNDGYRLRVRQGDGNDSNYTNSIIEIFAVDNNVVLTPALKTNTGLNRPGWKTVNSAATEPVLTTVHVLFNRDAGKFQITYKDKAAANYQPWDGTKVVPITLTGVPVGFAMTKVAVGTKGWSSGTPTAQVGNIALKTLQDGLETEDVTMETTLREVSRYPGVEAAFVYDLFDDYTGTSFESIQQYFGLRKVAKNVSTGLYELGAKKPAFDTYKNLVSEFGSLPPLGDIVLDDAFPSLAISASSIPVNPSPVVTIPAWEIDVAAPNYYYLGYKHDNNANKVGHTVRYYPPILPNGSAATVNYVVSIRTPAAATHATSVPVKIVHAGGASTVYINEQQNGGVWVNLGTYAFAPGEAATPATVNYVEIGNQGTSGRVVADAVKFHKAP